MTFILLRAGLAKLPTVKDAGANDNPNTDKIIITMKDKTEIELTVNRYADI